MVYVSENFPVLMLEASVSTVLAQLVSGRVKRLYAATALTALVAGGIVRALLRREEGSWHLGGRGSVQYSQLDCAGVSARPLLKAIR